MPKKTNKQTINKVAEFIGDERFCVYLAVFKPCMSPETNPLKLSYSQRLIERVLDDNLCQIMQANDGS